MDFSLSEQEKMLQGMAREFAIKTIGPRADDIDHSSRFPLDIVEEMGSRGYYGLPYPVAYGGSGAGYTSYALVLEQISRASMTAGAIMSVHTVPEEAIFRFGNEVQKQVLLTPLTSGELLGCIAFTEAETGSDPRAITTAARKNNGDYVVTGQKQFVANAPAANLALVFARCEQEGLAAFIMDTSSPGFNLREPCETMGLRGLGTSVIFLDDVCVPGDNRLGAEGQGYSILLDTICIERLGVAVQALGVAQAALELAIDYARERRAMNRPIAELSTIKWHLAEMATRIESTRWLVYRTAFLSDQGQDIKYESALVKLGASQMAVDVTRMAMQVHGAYGTMKTLSIERLYRDAKMTEMYVGVSEIQRIIIASYLI